MPIGKNAIKRAENKVENNGYANLTSSAPDMENSVIAQPKPTTEKKNAPKAKAPKTVTEKTVKTPVPAPVKSGKNGFERVEFGQDMPYWLL